MTKSSEYPEYVAQNVAIWTKNNADWTGPRARGAWSRDDITWGVFGVPESEVDALGDVAGLDVVELGCGTAYLSAWLAKQGARPVGVDPTPAQLETAREMQRDFGLEFPLVEAVGEDVPLPDASFDLAVSEFGASIWADPYRWIPEAARLIRPSGRLVFLRNSTVSVLSMDLDGVTESLQRPQRGLNRIEWPDTGEVEFHLPAGELIGVLGQNGFEIERLVELYAPDDAEMPVFYDYITPEWAQKWPAEEIWVARKRGNT
jgi:SAM-dependent methyltransferase